MTKIRTFVKCAAVAAAGMLWGGCQTQAPPPSGFLSDYSHLQRINDSTWSYVDSSRLGACSDFNVPPVTVMVKEYWGTTFMPDQKKRVADAFRLKIINAVSARYKVASGPGLKTPDIRVAITQAYRVGNSLALGVEAEIVDPATHQQLAALRGVQIGPPELSAKMSSHNPADPSHFTPAWWDWPSAVELMERWGDQIAKMIDQAHKH